MDEPWHQVNIAFAHWADSERTALAHLAPLLLGAEADARLDNWFFLRKTPCWRVRYRTGSDPTDLCPYLEQRLGQLQAAGHIDGFTRVIYEPEVHAFGGADGMAAAHRLFHLDSRHLLGHLAGPGPDRRREVSVLLCTVLLRAAGLDWYEIGDVFARVAEHRDLPEGDAAGRLHALEPDLRRLMSADAAAMTRPDGTLAALAEWARAFDDAGRQFAHLAAHGTLTRGLRDVLAHHVIFAWNRLGLPFTTQAALAHVAKAVVFGYDHPGRHQPDHCDAR